jgi:hypothetical protein
MSDDMVNVAIPTPAKDLGGTVTDGPGAGQDL